MLKHIKTKYDATEYWVREFNAFPQTLIEKAYMGENIDDIHEITLPSVYDRVYVFDCNESGEILEVLDDDKYKIKLNNDEIIEVDKDNFEVEKDGFLPMWGTMWQFDDSCDSWWIEDDEGLRAMSDCGFRVYEVEDLGYIFGIDGAGYNFYEQHWIPLYEKRGLEWHDKEEE